MKKYDDSSVLKKAAELKDDQTKDFGGLSIFRKQFGEYQRAKGTTPPDHRPVSRPYLEVLVQHKDAEGN
jgi:hypothetical protein